MSNGIITLNMAMMGLGLMSVMITFVGFGFRDIASDRREQDLVLRDIDALLGKDGDWVIPVFISALFLWLDCGKNDNKENYEESDKIERLLKMLRNKAVYHRGDKTDE